MSKNLVKKIFFGIFLFVFVISLFSDIDVFAKTVSFKVEDASIIDKSSGVEGSITSFDDDKVNSDVIFHKLSDSVTYKLEIKSNVDKEIEILSITDDNNNSYIDYSYDDYKNKKIKSNESFDFIVSAVYKNELTDISKRNQTNSVKFTITYLEDGEVKADTIVINPKTGDNIFINIIIFISSVSLIVFISLNKKIKNKKLSKVFVLVITGLILTPVMAKATYGIVIQSNIGLYDKLVVTIDDGKQTRLQTVSYNTTLDLSDGELEGYDFNNWKLDDNTVFDSNVPITEDITLTADYTKKKFSVSFDTNGGSSISSQTIEYGGKVTKPNNPTKSGYKFDKWYTDSSYTTEYDFDSLVKSKMTLYAKYKDLCDGFSIDSWSTIATNLSNDSDYYAVGCERKVAIDMDEDGEDESYTVRLVNTSTPESCSEEGYSQTACGIVIEFADIVDKRKMNNTNTNNGGWASTDMVTWLNSDFYNKLPSDLQNSIIPTYPIISGSGSSNNSPAITQADINKNKIYLLSLREVGRSNGNDYANSLTYGRTLDYYNSINYIRYKKDINGNINYWWLRTAYGYNNTFFTYINNKGTESSISATNVYGVAPAFRIGIN